MYQIRKIISNRKNYGSKRSTSDIKYIVVHYTANDGDTAYSNANYFKNTITNTSAHYFIDSKEVINTVDELFIAYHCGASKYYHACRNRTSIGIELTDDNKNGVSDFTQKQLTIANDLISDMMIKYNITIENVIRHYDVTRKICPKRFVQNIYEWIDFKNDIMNKKFIKSIQKACGAKIDGIVGKETISKTITISKNINSRHECVRYIQEYLNYMGYECGISDQIAGAKFDRAIKEYQKEVVGLKNPDGELTRAEKTWKTLLGA